MKTHSVRNTSALIAIQLAKLVAPLLAAAPAWADSGQRPEVTVSTAVYHHAPVTLWLVPHFGTSGMTSGKLSTNLSLSLVASGYARLQGVDIGVGASWVTDAVRGLQLTAGFNWSGGDTDGVQVSAGANITRNRLSGLQIASGVNYAGGGLFGAQIAAAGNLALDPVAGVQISGGFNYGSEIRGAQIGLVNIGGNVSGAQIGLINIGRRVRGSQIGLLNVADSSHAPVGLFNFMRSGQHHVGLWATENAPVNLGIKLGGQYVYSALTAGFERSGGKNRWLAGFGIGVHAPLADRFFLEGELLTLHVNEGESLDKRTNLLNTLRVVAGYQVHRHLSFFAGPTLNLLLTDVREEGFGLIHGTRVNSEQSETAVRVWPGFIAGFQI